MRKHKTALILCVIWLIFEPIFMGVQLLTSNSFVQKFDNFVGSSKASPNVKEQPLKSDNIVITSPNDVPDVVKQESKSTSLSSRKKIEELVVAGFDKLNKVFFDSLYTDINSLVLRASGQKYHTKGYYRTETDTLLPCTETTMDENQIYELENKIKRFKFYLDQEGVKFLYIQRPPKSYKYFKTCPMGTIGEVFNDSAGDNIINLCSREGIDYIDLREELFKSGRNWDDAFYKTDHHWKAETGFWAFQIIAETLREKYNFSFDKKITQVSSYNWEPNYKNNYFLGSYGRKTGRYFCDSLDSITKISPEFQTRYSIEILSETNELILPKIESSFEGTFEEVCLFEKNLVLTPTTLNLHTGIPTYNFYNDSDKSRYILNEIAPNDKKILFIRDSYACVLSPFLYGVCKEFYEIDLRLYHRESILECVARVKPDIVILMAGYISVPSFSFEEKSTLEYNQQR